MKQGIIQFSNPIKTEGSLQGSIRKQGGIHTLPAGGPFKRGGGTRRGLPVNAPGPARPALPVGRRMAAGQP